MATIHGMSGSIATRAAIRRFFTQGFTTRDITESLRSFDETTPSEVASETASQRGIPVVGVRVRGEIVGYGIVEDLTGGTCGDHIRYFGTDQLIDDALPLQQTIQGLDTHDFLFVKILGSPGGLVTRSDLEKPPARMWLLSLILMVEQIHHRMLSAFFPNGRWKSDLSPGRIEKAERLQRERKRRGQRLPLIDCLTYSDKTHVLFKDPEIRAMFGHASRTAARERVAEVEALRNYLAHNHGFVTETWPIVLALAERAELLLEAYVLEDVRHLRGLKERVGDAGD
jgi:hypothetical protein